MEQTANNYDYWEVITVEVANNQKVNHQPVLVWTVDETITGMRTFEM